MLGKREWAEEISKRYPANGGNRPQGERRYTGLNFSESKLRDFLDKQSSEDRKDLELQIRFECSGETIGEIAKKMKQKSYHAAAQRLYRIRQKMKGDKRFVVLVSRGISNVTC